MKISATALVLIGLAMLGLLTRWSDAQTPTDLRLVADATSQNLSLRFTDPASRAWTLQRSTDFKAWDDAGNFKVRNGFYRFTIARPGSETTSLFFRMKRLPNETKLPNAIADALTVPVPPSPPINYANLNLPLHLEFSGNRNQDNTPPDNPTTNTGALLGRVLFFDRRLSANGSVACASCHQPDHGFADSRRFSVGFAGELTHRNSMSLTSARYNSRGRFFWDERAATLEEQVLQPIQDPIEMGRTLPPLIEDLEGEEFYRELFEAVFGDDGITADRIAKALAQFIRAIVSKDTKFDEGALINFANFTDQERMGREIFQGVNGGPPCSKCHSTDHFVPPDVFNNGLEFPSIDPGIGGVTGKPEDIGKFKVPSLRNIALTAPYMHDGRFATLEEVVEFYNSGIVDHPNLAPELRAAPGPPGSPPPGPRRLNLTAEQKTALVAYLKTFTDRSLPSDPRFQDPFRYED
ncbi:MAG: cytochrome c peroxidase [Chthoniobacteraceae bacterium]